MANERAVFLDCFTKWGEKCPLLTAKNADGNCQSTPPTGLTLLKMLPVRILRVTENSMRTLPMRKRSQRRAGRG